ncbi:MAG TPA: hypothetical protein VGR48_19905 [Terriglobales bacterium]|nr:hypothetical protein [Terriglobales bacterium]
MAPLQSQVCRFRRNPDPDPGPIRDPEPDPEPEPGTSPDVVPEPGLDPASM